MIDTSERILKIFLSSTFRDMQEERDYIVYNIFPRIEVYCRDRGVEFKSTDLRWGITEEECKNGAVIETCLEKGTTAKYEPLAELYLV